MDEKECRTLEANLQYVRSVFCGRTKKWWAKKHALTPSGKASQDGKNEWHGQESTAKHAKHAKNSETVLASAPVQEKREMTRMIKCLLLRLLFAVLMVVPQQLRAADRPNVLFIAVDDLRDTLGCYGNSAVNVGPTTD